jgi:uncharacterized protein
VSQENINVVQSFFDALGRGDMDAAAAALDAQIEWTEPGVPGQWFAGTRHGVDAVFAEVVGQTPEHVAEFSLHIDQFLEAGEYVVALGQFRGRGKRSGRAFSIPGAFFYTVRGNKIVRFQAYHDTAQWLLALG